MSRVAATRDLVLIGRECDRLLGVVWTDRGFWRRPAARRLECGGPLRLTRKRVWCPVCATLAGKVWESELPPRTLFTLTRRRRNRALVAALRVGGLA